MNHRQEPQFLREGETCWRRCRASRAAMLVDGARYYGALRSSLLSARRCVFVVGWDIDSRTAIRGDARPDDGAPEALGPLLTFLAERNPALRIYVLLWDYSLLYADEREPLPRLNLGWRTPSGVSVCLDDEIPVGASQHEKLVVVDDAVAFCGGLDLTVRRWDTSEHLPGNPHRTDPGEAPYGPFHDVQMVVDGDAAQALGQLVRARWTAAARADPLACRPQADPWPQGVDADLTDVVIGIARTRAPYDEKPALTQVQTAYLEAIARAERLIYIENQYLTVERIADALRERQRSCETLELVIINPRLPGGWLEAQTMGLGRQRFVRRLLEDDSGPRVRVMFPWVMDGEEKCAVMVHAKLMIVDDAMLQVGSSNLNHRSMGLDTECDLLIEAESEGQRQAIGRLRRRLLAEHLGLEPDELAERERRAGSVIAALSQVEPRGRGLTVLEDPQVEEEPWSDAVLALADREKPIAPEEYLGDMFGAKRVRPMLRRAGRFAMLALVVAAGVALWRFTPLSEWTDPARLVPLLEQLSASPWAGPLVLAAFLLGSLLVFPVTVLIAATAIALGPWSGFAWSLAGCLLGASVTYAVGRLLGRERLEAWLGRWVARADERLRRGGIVAVMVIRNVPVAPFTVVNVVAGSIVRFRDFLLGTVLGMGPGIAAVTLLGDRLRSVWENPSGGNLSLLGLALAVWIGIALGLQALSNRLSDR